MDETVLTTLAHGFHNRWFARKRALNVTTRISAETGEELMQPAHLLKPETLRESVEMARDALELLAEAGYTVSK